MATTMKQWKVTGKGGFADLKFDENAQVPEVGDKDVLVKRNIDDHMAQRPLTNICQVHAASLNYRDILITRGRYPFGQSFPIVPGSDGAGTVEAVGRQVTRFKKGDKVVTLFNQGHLAGPLDQQTLATGLGGKVDGVLRQYGAFDENGLVHMPSNLNYLEASTLSCAPLTAWNALYGLKDLKPGDWVLTQGTGGVSVTALQFAKAAGARVIATTSSNDKATKLRQLGADHIINYKEDEKWGETAKKLTGGRGGEYINSQKGNLNYVLPTWCLTRLS
jgi:NADPH:quinone reductase-like Zn-dependent oxidoreductase